MAKTPKLTSIKESQLVKRYYEINRQLRAGEITVEQLQTEWTVWQANKVQWLEEVGTLPNKTLAHYVSRAGTKPEMLSSFWGRMVYGSLLAPFEGEGWMPTEEKWEWFVTRVLRDATPEKLAAYVNKVEEAVKKNIKAVTDPETFEEWRKYVAYKGGVQALTDEELEVWDAFNATDMMERFEAEREREAQVGKINLDEGVVFEIREDWHTKQECKIWVVKLSQRVDSIQWKEYDAKARKFGARWSSWGPVEKHGWIFFNESDAAAFMDLTEGDGNVIDRWNRKREEKQQSAALRLTDQAQNKEEAALEEMNRERLTNTPRRAGQAEAAMKDAARDLEYVQVLQSIANAIGEKKVAFLKFVRYGTHIDTLEWLLGAARDARTRSMNNGGIPEKEYHRPPTLADVRFAKMPWPTLSRSTVVQFVRITEGKRGMKSSRQLVASLANEQARETVEFNSWQAINAMKELMDGNPPKYEGWYWQDIERLRAMKIMDVLMLRAALREFLLYRKVQPVAMDKARIMELNLVGLKIPGFFPTPKTLAERMVDMAGIDGGFHWRILEPSAGSGRIADAIKEKMAASAVLDVIECSWTLREVLQAKGYNIVSDDCLNWFQMEPPTYYDRILMNPPFENNQDVEHVFSAWQHLKSGGRLVAIMGKHWQFAQEDRCVAFRAWIDEVGAEVEDLPEGTFKESGTGVNTVLVTIDRPEE